MERGLEGREMDFEDFEVCAAEGTKDAVDGVHLWDEWMIVEWEAGGIPVARGTAQTDDGKVKFLDSDCVSLRATRIVGELVFDVCCPASFDAGNKFYDRHKCQASRSRQATMQDLVESSHN